MKKTKQNLHEECEKHKSPCHRFVLYEEEMKNETDYYST